ncbi:hypothetical protein [Clostridium perfringens]|uniref:hypothetical protein n=1 Tax=Clostridium perfringens TaxID=1502 RepID=UPI0039EA22FA
MKKYRVTVEITKEFEIEIDETIITEEALDGFEEVFYKLDEENDRYASMANDYCRLRAMNGDSFIEGYGYVLENGEPSFGAKINKEKPNTAINLIESDDEGDYDITVYEI